MTVSSDLKAAFRYHMQKGVGYQLIREAAQCGYVPNNFGRNCDLSNPEHANTYRAKLALFAARKDVWEGVKRYPLNPTVSAWGAPQKDGTRYLESLDRCGLRFVGLAHDVAKGFYRNCGLRHTGHYVDMYQNETIAGAIFRLSGKGKAARYVVGYNDPWNEGYSIDLNHVIEGDKLQSSYDDDDALRDCVSASDSLAKHEAERMREYDTAWQAGRLFAECGAENARYRKDVLAILKERKIVAGVNAPSLCAAIVAQVRTLLNMIEDNRAKREKLRNGEYESRHEYYGFYTGNADLMAAFNDGAAH